MNLFAGQNWCISENPGTRFLATTWVLGTLQYAPKAYPVKFYGLEYWGWAVVAVTAEVNPNPCNIHTGLKHLFQWRAERTARFEFVALFQRVSLESLIKNRFAPTWAVHFFHSFANSPAKRGVQKPDLDPRPPDLHQNVRNIIANTPGKLLAPEGSFFNPFSGRDFHPAHLSTSRHKQSMQSCSVGSSLRSCILRSGWELWGKNSHKNG